MGDAFCRHDARRTVVEQSQDGGAARQGGAGAGREPTPGFGCHDDSRWKFRWPALLAAGTRTTVLLARRDQPARVQRRELLRVLARRLALVVAGGRRLVAALADRLPHRRRHAHPRRRGAKCALSPGSPPPRRPVDVGQRRSIRRRFCITAGSCGSFLRRFDAATAALTAALAM